jgi:glycosyltransferase involved in cell wall biosynthesis/O-antigen/teichoic acid export membrane protein
VRPKVVYVIAEVFKAYTFEWLATSDIRERCELSFILLNSENTYLEEFLRKQGFEVTRLHYKGRGDLPRITFQLLWAWLRKRPDVVHTHQIPANLTGLFAATLLGIRKRIYTRHHSIVNRSKRLASLIYDRLPNFLSTLIIATCENVKNVLLEEGVSQDKIKVIRFGFEEKHFRDISQERIDKLKAKYQISGNSPVIGVISRYTEWKGIQYIIPAFKRLLEKYPDALLILANASKSSYSDKIQALLSEIPKINYFEIPFDDDNGVLYRLFDVFVHTPIDLASEAFGQTYVEALFAGVPSIFTLSGVAVEFARHRENCWVADYKNSEEIYEGLNAILSDKDFREKLSRQGWEDARQGFRLKDMLDSLDDSFRTERPRPGFLNWIRDSWQKILKVPFIHSNIILGIVTGTRFVVGLLKTKISAIFLGPSGAGLLGIGSQVQMLGVTWGSLSMSSGFLNRLSAASGESDPSQKREILSTTFTIQLLCNGFCLIAGIALAPWLSKLAFGDASMSKYVVPVLVSVPFYSLITVYFNGIFFTHGQYAAYSRASVISGVLEAILFSMGIYFWGVQGAFWALPIGAAIWGLLLLRPLLRLESARDLFRIKLNKSAARFLIDSGFIMILAGSAAYLCSILIRIWITRSLGIAQAGIYQVVTVLFGYYSPFITNGIWAQLFPRASRDGISAATGREWYHSFFITAVFGGLIQVAFLIMPERLISLIYTKEFSEAAHIFPIQCLGDFLFLLAQPSFGVLLGMRKTLNYLWVNLAYYAGISLLSFLFVHRWGLIGAASAYLICGAGLLTWSLTYYTRMAGKDIGLLRFISVITALVAFQGFLAWNHASFILRGLTLGMFLIWMAYVFKERSGKSVAANATLCPQ